MITNTVLSPQQISWSAALAATAWAKIARTGSRRNMSGSITPDRAVHDLDGVEIEELARFAKDGDESSFVNWLTALGGEEACAAH